MKSFSVCRLHQTGTQEWRIFDESNELTCAAYDVSTRNLYIGQHHGHVYQINIQELGTHSPRLLGKHGGNVNAMCIYPFNTGTAGSKISLVASGSADSTIKIWTHDPRILHSAKACIQTLYGHTAAVTCVTAVQQYLVSGSVDGSVLLWQPSDTGLLALPRFHATATLWSDHQWILSLSCQPQQAEVGAGQGVFVAVANQPLLRLSLDKPARQSDDCSVSKMHARIFAQPYDACPIQKSCDRLQHSAQHYCQQQQVTQSKSLSHVNGSTSSSADAINAGNASTHSRRHAVHNGGLTQSSCLHRQRRQGLDTNSSVSVFAVQYVAHQLAVLTLAYDGCCRMHSAVDGGLLCRWHSSGRSSFCAMDCTGTVGEVLLGDDQGALHIYSLGSEQLLAVKQLTRSRITTILCCGSSASSTSILSSNSTCDESQGRSSTQFIVLSQEGLGLWELQRNLPHGILPGGHKQAVLALRVLQLNMSSMQSIISDPTNNDEEPSSNLLASTDTAVGTSSRGASMLISAGLDNRVLQWDLAAYPSVLTDLGVDSIGSELSAMSFLHDWALLATGHENGQICLWRMDTGTKVLLESSAHTNTVCCLAPAVIKADELLLSASFDGCVTLWEPRMLRGVKPHMLARFQAFGLSTEELSAAYHLAMMSALSSSSGSLKAARSTNSSRVQSAAAWRRKDQTADASSAISCNDTCNHSRASSPGVSGAQHLAIIGSGDATSLTEMLQSRCSSASVRPGLVDQGKAASNNASHLQRQQSPVAAHCSGQMQAQNPACSANNPSITAKAVDVMLWDSQHAAALRRQQSGHDSPTTAAQSAAAVKAALVTEAPEVLVVVFDSVQQVLVTAGNAEAIRVWSGNCTGELLGQHIGHAGPVNCLKVDGNLLFSGSDDTTIRMWDLVPPHFVHRSTTTAAQGAAAAGATVAGTAGSCTGVSGSQQLQTLRVSNPGHTMDSTADMMGQSSPTKQMPAAIGGPVPSSAAFQVLHGHTAAVTGIDIVQSTGVLVSCGKDGRILQWDYSTGQLIREQHLVDVRFLCLAVHQGTRQAYAGASSGQVLNFDVTAVVDTDTVGPSGK